MAKLSGVLRGPRIATRAVVVVAVAACAAPKPPPPPPERPAIEAAPRPQLPAVMVLATETSPMSLVVAGSALVWTDSAGAVWTMPSDGSGKPRQLGDQREPGFAFKIVVVGSRVFATVRGDLLRVPLPVGRAVRAGIGGLGESPVEAVGDTTHVYMTLFKRDEVMRVPVDGGDAVKLASVPRGVLGLHGDTLYVASYSAGTLFAVPTAGGKPRLIARGFVRPTAVAADATHVYVYSERDQNVQRVDVRTGARETIATGLINSDELVLDGDWVYTRSWTDAGGQLVRVRRDGRGGAQVIGERISAPYAIAIDDDAVYVSARDGNRILRFTKAALRARDGGSTLAQ